MDQPLIHNPHDKFFKEAFSHIDVVRSFVETYLQSRVHFRINLNNFQLYQNDSVDSSLKEAFSDLIYKTETIPEKVPVYLLFEHKRTLDPHADTQIKNYELMLRQNLLRSHSVDSAYIIPIIIYNGERNCNLSCDNKLISYTKYSRDFSCEFFDVSHMPDDQIRGSAFLRIVFLALKYVPGEQILNKLDDFAVLFKEMPEGIIEIYLNTFSHYVESAAPKNIRHQLVERIRSWERRMDMPEVSELFQRLKNEGREEGVKEGIKRE